MDSILTAIIM